MEPFLFAFWVFTQSNPWYSGQTFAYPLDYAVEAYHAAEEFDLVEPEHMVTVGLSEHAYQGHRVRQDSVSNKGAKGVYQVMDHERRAYERHFGLEQGSVNLLEWRTSTRVAAFVIWDDMHTHLIEQPNRCSGRVFDGYVQGDDGELVEAYRAREHSWHAHYLCGPGIRDSIKDDGEPRCPVRRREKLEVILKGWRSWWPVKLNRAVETWRASSVQRTALRSGREGH